MGTLGIFALPPERSHINATLGLARALRNAGHEVVYLAVADQVAHLRKQGFAVRVVYEDIMPLGIEAEIERRPALALDLRAMIWARMEDPRFDAVVLDAGLDLVLVDTWAYPAALFAYRLGLPVVMVNPTLPIARDETIPPTREFIVPRDTWSRVRAKLAWKKLDLIAKLKARNRQAPLSSVATAALAKAGFPRGLVDGRAPFPRLNGFPELVLCPQAFDLPRAVVPNIYYAEAFVDVERDDDYPLDASVFDDARPLVYCAFGTNTYRYPKIRDLLAASIEALGALPHVRGLVSLGRQASPAELGTAPANVTLVSHAPQLDVLRHARVMIHHGGLNSVKECIHAGVPMLVIPWGLPVNAVRVEYHGLGSVVLPRDATPETIRRHVAAILEDDAMRSRVAQMREAFAAAARSTTALRVIESRLPMAARVGPLTVRA